MKRVFITRRLPSIATTLLRERFHVEHSSENKPYPPSDLARLTEEYDAILSTVSEKFDGAVLRQRGRLRVISNYAVGLDNIDLGVARAMGIAVYNTPDVVTNSTADLTFAILLSLLRQIPDAQRFVRADEWMAWNPELFVGEELFGKVFGILGFGKIGQAVGRRAIGFGLEVIYHSNGMTPIDPLLRGVARAVSFDELLEQSDYLSIHVPLNGETTGLINGRALAAMRRRPILLNMARGGVVVTDDLLAALDAGTIRGCGMDVTTPEPLRGDHPLCLRANALVVPHIGTATRDCRHAMAALAAQNILDHFTEAVR